MDPSVPSVVAVVVTRDAGPWLDATLASLAVQDYAEFSVLVLVANDDPQVLARVAAAAPLAFVRSTDPSLGYGPTTNLVLEMVDGAAFFLLCHDDVVLDGDAVSRLVEVALRENAGIITPKLVAIDDPTVLLHVGQSADRTGAVIERISPGEIDHGQHDAVRDVFVAPGGANLIRADLFAELGGYDPGILAMGEDLELSWRAQVAGARVVVAPAARVRHVHVQELRTSIVDDASLQQLQRRHELRTVLVNSSKATLLFILPLLILLSFNEWLVAMIGRDEPRVASIVGAWKFNLVQRRELLRRRATVQASRRVADRDLKERQSKGTTRLRTFASRLFYQGLAAARGVVGFEDHDAKDLELTATIGEAFSENQDFDDLDDLGHHATSRRGKRSSPLSTRSGRAAVYGIAIALFLVGSRNLLFAPVPYLGQFAPWPSFTTSIANWFSSWHPTFLGGTDPAPTTFATMALLAVPTFGHMGLAQDLAILLSLPIGVIGIRRLVGPFVSPRSRLVASLAYACLGLWPSAVALGWFDGLVAVAISPWLLLGLLRTAGVAPFAVPVLEVPLGSRGWAWTTRGRLLGLSVLLAASATFAPALLVVVVLLVIGVILGDLPFGAAGGIRMFRTALITIGASALLLGPWIAGMFLHPATVLSVFGLPSNPATAPSLSAIVTFSIGGASPTWWSWALLVGAVLPLLVLRGERLAFATRLTSIALCSWALAAASSWHLLAGFSPRPEVILAPAAVSVACLVGLALSGFEVELGELAFGWRQLVVVGGLAFSTLSVLTMAVALPTGTWGLGTIGVDQSLHQVQKALATSGGRVLWLGDPAVLPVAGASLEPGLAYATTTSTTTSGWAAVPAGNPGAGALLGASIHDLLQGRTSSLGRELAVGAIRFIVVIESSAPSIAEVQVHGAKPAPPELVKSLRSQGDLTELSGSGGLEVFSVDDGLALAANRSTPAPAGPIENSATLSGWAAALTPQPDGLGGAGPVGAGSVLVAAAPAGSLQLTVDGVSVSQVAGPASIAQFTVPKGLAQVSVKTSGIVPFLVLLEAFVWLLVVLLLTGRLSAMRRRAEGLVAKRRFNARQQLQAASTKTAQGEAS